TTGLHLDRGLHVVERGGQQVDGITALLAGLLADAVDRTIENLLGGGLLAVLHDHVHELGQHFAVELGIREDGPGRGCGATGHGVLPSENSVTSSGAWRRTSNDSGGG